MIFRTSTGVLIKGQWATYGFKAMLWILLLFNHRVSSLWSEQELPLCMRVRWMYHSISKNHKVTHPPVYCEENTVEAVSRSPVTMMKTSDVENGWTDGWITEWYGGFTLSLSNFGSYLDYLFFVVPLKLQDSYLMCRPKAFFSNRLDLKIVYSWVQMISLQIHNCYPVQDEHGNKAQQEMDFPPGLVCSQLRGDDGNHDTMTHIT